MSPVGTSGLDRDLVQRNPVEDHLTDTHTLKLVPRPLGALSQLTKLLRPALVPMVLLEC